MACSSQPPAPPDTDPPDTPPTACPAVTGTPQPHDETVREDETWRAEGGPHIVQWETRIAPGVTLTIEPCAQVIFRQDAAMSLSGEGARLVTEGTAARPITFAGEDGARWGALTVSHPAGASLRYVHFSDGGGNKFQAFATIAIHGAATTPVAAPVLLDHVTVEGSRGPGVRLTEAAAFAPGSTALTIHGSGGDEVPYPLAIGEHAIDSLPEGTYTGNRVDEILVAPEGANGSSTLQHDTRMRDPGVPYHIGTFPTDHLTVGAGNTNPPHRTVLTIDPGVVLKFTPSARLDVGNEFYDEPASGVLRVLGTAARPVVFTSAQPSPQRGDWAGLFFYGVADAEDRIEHAVLEYTGSDCSCSLVTCNTTGRHDSAVIFVAPPPSAFIRDSRIAHGAGHGIFRGWTSDDQIDLTPTNTFEDLAGCAQTLPTDSKGHCPADAPACPE